MAKRLILIDLSSIWHMAWHASAELELGEAFKKTVNRVHGFVNGFDLAAVCCDAPPYRRKALLETYKSRRDEPAENMVAQFRRVKERLEADGLLLWSSKGYEADDVIAWATREAIREELDVTIASADKDLMALIDDARGVRMVSTATGQVWSELEVRQRFGVSPPLIPDLLALMGDKSDDVPGIPGVGKKRAAALLDEFGNALNVYECRGSVKGAVGDALREHGHRIDVALKLVTLEADVPLDFDQLYAEREVKPLANDSDWKEEEFTSTPEAAVAEAPQREELRAVPPPPPDEPKQTGLAVVRPQPPEWSLALEPASPRDASIVARKLLNSRLYPQFQSEEAVFAVILRGRALGLDSATSLATFHVVEGRPTMHADLVVGLVLRSGKAEFFDLIETTHERATYITKRKGARKEVEVTWTLEDALRAGLVTKDERGRYRGVSKSGRASNWDKYPRAMLRHRAATEVARAVYPDVTCGLYAPDEIGEVPEVIEAELVG
jgi:5'-3' exonuclease